MPCKVNLFQNIIIVFCFFVYLFPFKAYGADPRLLVFLIYFVLLLKNGRIRFIGIKSKYIKVLKYPLLMMFFTIFTCVFNEQPETTFLIFPFQIIYLLLLSYCIYYILKHYCGYVDFYVITKYFIISLVVQSVIAIIMFVNHPICMFLFELQGIDLASTALERYFGMRLIGLGCFYFGAGAIYGLGLISIIPLMLKAKDNRQIIKLLLLYVYIFIVGLFFARTSMIGCALSIMYLCCCILVPKIGHKASAIFRRFIAYITVLGIVLIGIYNSSPKLQDEYGDIIKFGFEAFINLAESGEFSTKSSDGLKEYHLNIWPEDTKTYYIGDTRWTHGDGYYGDSDVGYIRLLYYFGIPGVILFLCYQYSVTKTMQSLYKRKVFTLFFITIFLYAVILLIKGYIDIAAMIFIYLHYKPSDSNYENRVLC